MGDVVALRQVARIGLTVKDIGLDWGLGRPGAGELYDAMAELVGRAADSLDACRRSIEGARQQQTAALCALGAKASFRGFVEAGGVATAFGLSVRHQAVLIELRWAAASEAVGELQSHLAVALEKLGELEAAEREHATLKVDREAWAAAFQREMEEIEGMGIDPANGGDVA